MQKLKLVLDHDNFFCPVTGKQILSDDRFSPSSATAFVFSPETDEFEFLREDFTAIDRKANPKKIMDKRPLGRFSRFRKALVDRPNVVMFSITRRDLACGPVDETIHIGIDMDIQGNE